MMSVVMKTSLNSRFFLIATFLCHFTYSYVHAQSPSEETAAPNGRLGISLNLSLYLMIIALVSAFAFIGLFFSLSLRYCWRSQVHQPGLGNPTAGFNSCPHGVDPAVVDSFPIFVYSTIKEHKIGKGVHECAVCLSEFRDCDTLLLLPKCDHVFHPDCINAWLAFHVTCPVCRANLTEKPESCGCGTTIAEISTSATNAGTETDPVNFSIVIGGNEPEYSEKGQQQVVITVYPDESSNISSEQTEVNVKDNLCTSPEEECRPRESRMSYNLQRSHSTGHSLIRPGNNLERYTLRLPEEVRKLLIMNRTKHRRSASYDVVLLGDMNSPVKQ